MTSDVPAIHECYLVTLQAATLPHLTFRTKSAGIDVLSSDAIASHPTPKPKRLEIDDHIEAIALNAKLLK